MYLFYVTEVYFFMMILSIVFNSLIYYEKKHTVLIFSKIKFMMMALSITDCLLFKVGLLKKAYYWHGYIGYLRQGIVQIVERF